MNFEKLRKLLALTTSDSENEALNAVRQANKLLKENNLTWDYFFSIQDLNLKQEVEKLRVEYTLLAQKYNNLLAQRLVSLRIFSQRPPGRRHRRL